MTGPAWESEDDEIDLSLIGLAGWCRAAIKIALGIILVCCGLIVLLALRLIERPLCGMRRPVTPYITQFVCRSLLWIFGISLSVRGETMRHHGAIVANHSSWLDIFALNATQRIYFVSKSEVASWPGIGWLARATGTIFIERNPRKAKEQKELFEARLQAGHKLLFFPEGTSTDGIRVLPFKSTLFAAFFAPALRDILWVQPVTMNYYAASGEDIRFYGWWGEMDFATHMVRVLAAPRQGRIEVIYHAAQQVSQAVDRKTMAQDCERQVASAHHVAGAAH